MRPLMVRTEKGSGPLFCRRLPVSGWFGGGESRLLGLEAELDGGLVGGLAEAGQEIADLLLAGVDDPAGWGLVDGIGHPPAELLELGAELLDEGLGGDLRWIIHGWFLGVGSAEANASPGPSAVHRLRYALPEDLPRPYGHSCHRGAIREGWSSSLVGWVESSKPTTLPRRNLVGLEDSTHPT